MLRQICSNHNLGKTGEKVNAYARIEKRRWLHPILTFVIFYCRSSCRHTKFRGLVSRESWPFARLQHDATIRALIRNVTGNHLSYCGYWRMTARSVALDLQKVTCCSEYKFYFSFLRESYFKRQPASAVSVYICTQEQWKDLLKKHTNMSAATCGEIHWWSKLPDKLYSAAFCSWQRQYAPNGDADVR